VQSRRGVDRDARSAVHGAWRPAARARQEREGLRGRLHRPLAGPEVGEEREVEAESGGRGGVNAMPAAREPPERIKGRSAQGKHSPVGARLAAECPREAR